MPNIRKDIDPDYVVREYNRLRYEEGKGMRSLARELGCSVSPIRRILEDAGVDITQPPRKPDYMSPEEIERTREIHGMWQRGGSCASISRSTGMKYSEVQRRLISAQVGRFDIPVHRRSEHTFGQPGPRTLWETPEGRRVRQEQEQKRAHARKYGDARAWAGALDRAAQRAANGG